MKISRRQFVKAMAAMSAADRRVAVPTRPPVGGIFIKNKLVEV